MTACFRSLLSFPRSSVGWSTLALRPGNGGRRVRCIVTSLMARRSSGEPLQAAQEKEGSFAEMFRNSKFALVGNPVGKVVEGQVVAVSGKDAYVDFGCKFHAVVSLPSEEQESYCRGANVLVRVKDLEMTDHFIGDSRDTTLLEAEAELIGLSTVQPTS